jgi:Phosphopantothenoylcysteine synthetase/decarboxylase
MAGKGDKLRVLVTAGPTAEDIDPVRYITNRSTGRMGIAIAEAVRDFGGEALLVLGPTEVCQPEGVKTIRVRSAKDMLDAVVQNLVWADSLVMTAAVADYTPAEPLESKLKKTDGDFFLRLKRTADILREVANHPDCGYTVGFSLDVGVNVEEGRRKLASKDLDLIVVNSAASFGSSAIDAVVIDCTGEAEKLGVVGKDRLAARLVERIAEAVQNS